MESSYPKVGWLILKKAFHQQPRGLFRRKPHAQAGAGHAHTQARQQQQHFAGCSLSHIHNARDTTHTSTTHTHEDTTQPPPRHQFVRGECFFLQGIFGACSEERKYNCSIIFCLSSSSIVTQQKLKGQRLNVDAGSSSNAATGPAATKRVLTNEGTPVSWWASSMVCVV